MAGSRGRRITIENKACAIKLIEEAQQLGARKSKACEILGINLRFVQRWENRDDLADNRKGPLHLPKHTLTEKERKRLVNPIYQNY